MFLCLSDAFVVLLLPFLGQSVVCVWSEGEAQSLSNTEQHLGFLGQPDLTGVDFYTHWTSLSTTQLRPNKYSVTDKLSNLVPVFLCVCIWVQAKRKLNRYMIKHHSGICLLMRLQLEGG